MLGLPHSINLAFSTDGLGKSISRKSFPDVSRSVILPVLRKVSLVTVG